MTDIRIDLSVPVLSFGVGPFQFDPVTSLLGCTFESIVESLMVAPAYRRTVASGGQVEVFPLALPDGEGAALPLGRFGEAGFHNRSGELVLHVPRSLGATVLPRLQRLLVRPLGTVQTPSGVVTEAALRLQPGMAFRLPLGGLGELGVECV
jgi:hypothetical protein